MGPGSLVTRWWNAVQPLPSEQIVDPAILAHKHKQRRLIGYSLSLVILVAASLYGYDYVGRAPERARAEFDKGMLLMGPGSYPEAIRAFDRSIAISPNSAEAHLNRGVALHNLGRMNDALEEFDKATDLDPYLTRPYDERGRIDLEKDDTRKAIGEFSKSIDIKPTTDGYYARGLAYESTGEHQKAVDDYDKAIAELVDAPYAYRARALARANLGDLEGAKADRDKALHIEHPDLK